MLTLVWGTINDDMTSVMLARQSESGRPGAEAVTKVTKCMTAIRP
jgi:hypothetical protein